MNQKPVVPVVFATDRNYAPYCSVSIASLMKHRDPEREYAVYIFCEKTGEDYCRILENMSQPGVTIRCLDVSRYVDRDKFYVHSYFSIATYYRMFAPEILSQYDKILYLDCDLVVLSDVGALYDTEIGDNYLAAVHDRGLVDVPDKYLLDYVRDLGNGLIPEDYFNAGVLVMNLKQFREESVGQKCMEYMAQHPKLKWQDQDVLNVICHGRVVYLPEKWNKKQYYYNYDMLDSGERPEACILHYVGGNKPWNSECSSASFPFYLAALLTPYREELLLRFEKVNPPFEVQLRGKVKTGEVGLYRMREVFVLWVRRKWKDLFHK